MRRLFKRELPLRRHIYLLIFLTLAPLLFFSIVLLVFFGRSEQASIARGLKETSRALTVAVDRELESSMRTLAALVTSELLDSDRFPEFYQLCRRVLASQRGWKNVILHDPSGKAIFNLLRPFGSDLPAVIEQKSFAEVLRTGKPAIERLIKDPITGVTAGVRVPVLRDGEIKYVLTALFDPDLFQQIFHEQNLPANWVGTVYDQEKTIIARTHAIEKLLGQPAGPLVKQAPHDVREGWLKGFNRDGVMSYAAYSQSPFSGWSVAIAVPAAVLNLPFYRSMSLILALGIGSLLVGIALAIFIGRRIYQSVGLLKSLANTLGHGEAIAKPERSKVSELNEVSHVLEDASRLLQNRAAERDRVEEDLRSLGRELEKRVSSRTAELAVANEILLRQAELLDLTHDAVLVRGFVAGRINVWNRGATEMYGWTSEEVIGKIFHALLQTKFPEPAEKIEEQLAFIGRWEGELVQTKKDGGKLTVMSRWSVRRDPHGRPIAILEVNSDITAKKQAEKKAHEAEKLATLGSTAAVFAHEIGNPLNGITASLQLALQQLKSCPDNIDDITSSLRDGVREIGRLGALLQEFRAFVRPQLLRREPTDLQNIVRETINMQLAVCAAAGIKVEVLVKDVLPPVPADAAKIKQVFLNLFKNACEAMPNGGLLRVRAYLFEETVTVEISDTGCGIPDGANVFEPFQSSKPDGMGLGLAIVRQIISAHGGTVEYTSENHKGTTFKVQLPAAR